MIFLADVSSSSLKPYLANCRYNHCMPIITLAMFSGRTQREKDRFAEAITESAVKILEVERKDVIVVFQEEPHGNWYASGVRL
jgi:4-oxalocrotonate tautomerase